MSKFKVAPWSRHCEISRKRRLLERGPSKYRSVCFALWCGTQSSCTVLWLSALQFGVIDVTDRHSIPLSTKFELKPGKFRQ